MEIDKNSLNYIATKKILVADPIQASRSTIQKMLLDLGAKPANVKIARDYNDAMAYMESARPQIVFTDFVLDGHSALDLHTIHHRVHFNLLETVFIFISAQSPNTLACLLAQDEIDAVVVKPFTIAALKEKFLATVASKANATDYMKLIQKGKMLLMAKQYDEALQTFLRARPLDAKPAAAFFYEGQIQKQLGNHEEAIRLYERALEFHPTHYKSLQSLIEALTEAKQYEDAYAYCQKLNKSYPLNPQLIPAMIRLSVLNKKFDDIFGFYETFSSLEERDEGVANNIAAGLVVCGKNFLEQKMIEAALKSFSRAESISKGRTNITKEIVAVLYVNAMVNEAETILKRCPDEIKTSPEVEVARLEHLNQISAPDRVLQCGLELIQRGIKNSRVFEIVMVRSVELKRSASAIEDILTKATAAFPDKKAFYESLARDGKTKS